ncbi:nucleoside hydrolase [Albirhodobacter sp. R86504]|jgi:purine nucleosidase|uniref:nucleoside hydrolase n=1 Tax=Albirhodobacter sp. R86504 TaxID=3093848 RepID=UPI003672363D
MTQTQKIIIDTDPGQDDAVAILLALASPELDVLAVTAVAGNVPLVLTHTNARKICELAGRRDVPVYAGCDRPLARDLVTAEYIHGVSGLDGISLPEPQMPLSEGDGVDVIINHVMNEPAGTVSLCVLGPLTNIATALRRAPQIADRVKQIVLMGGAYFEVGNVTPAAEFNIYVDPEAAQAVFQSGIRIVVLPLDVTHKALTTPARVARFREMAGGAENRARLGRGQPSIGEVVASWIDFFERFDVEKYGAEGAPLHDPCVIAYLLAPELFKGREVNVEIEVDSPLTRGMTVADWWRVTGREANALFLRDVDADAFFDLLVTRIGRL